MQADSPTPVGRVALYVSKALKSFPRSDVTLDMPLVESVWVDIATPKNKKIQLLLAVSTNIQVQILMNLMANLMKK